MTHRIPATHRTRAARASRYESGLSLIEVLVAIAILTIGVLSVITLFPAGFLTLEIAANATNADRIGQRELEKLNATNAGQMAIIQSIYSNYDAALDTMPGTCQPPAAYSPPSIAGSNPCAVPTLTPANLPADTPIPLGLNNDIDQYRLVKGEMVRVPPAIGPVNGTQLSLYTPAFAPIVSPANGSVAGQPPSVFAVHGLPWARISENSVGQSNASNYGDPSAQLGTNQPQYLIDYTNGEIALPSATYPQTVLFQFTDGTKSATYPAGITYHVSITVPATLSAQWIDPFGSVFLGTAGASTTSLTIVPALPVSPAEPMLPWKTGSDILSRDFVNVTPGAGYSAASFGGDPYQFQFFQADITAASPYANLGTIAFNPIGAGIKDTNGRPLMAAIDYEVYDWHIISEDRTVANPASGNPTNSSLSVRLSLRSLYSKTAHDTYSDNTAYHGLFYGTPAASNLDVTVLDLQNGVVLTQNADFSVNYPDGVITVTNTAYDNVPLRIFYRARLDWGVALSKAPSNYVIDDLPSAAYLPQYGECALDAANQILYFPLADVGKTVQVLGLTGTDTAGTLPNIDLGLQTIIKDSGNTRGEISLAQAGALGGNPFPAGTTLYTVAQGQSGTVQGSTVQAQVVWKEQGLWKHREIASVIAANPTQNAVQQ